MYKYLWLVIYVGLPFQIFWIFCNEFDIFSDVFLFFFFLKETIDGTIDDSYNEEKSF